MLLPFIPFLIALAGLTLIGMEPAAMPPPQGWELAAAYCALPLLGALVGNLPESWLGSRSPMRIGRRRLVLLALWMAVAAGLAVLHGWLALLADTQGGEEAALILMLGNFWLSDSLALQPANPLLLGALPGQLRRLARNLGVSVPILVLVMLGLGFSALSTAFPALEEALAWLPPWARMVGSIGLYLGVAGLLVPVLIPVCWRLRRLESAAAEEVIRKELAANGVSVARVLNWPADMMGHATAGVIGIVPRFRFLLFADVLAEALSAEEIRSVTAHEAEHIRQRHLWYMFAAILAFVLFTEVLLEALALSGLWLGFILPLWTITVIEIGGLLVFFRFGLGFISRNFERQADGNALRRRGFAAFQAALLKIARLNGIREQDDNWHHHGIGRRLDYLRQAEQGPEALARHDRVVFRIKAACLAILAACMIGQAVFSGSGVVSYAVETYWMDGLEQVADPSPTELQGLRFMAMRAYEREDFPAAERYFRKLLRATPDDPGLQNNLAWLLVTLPEAGPAQLQEGLRLARQAARAGEVAFIQDTLAEAYYQAGRMEDSVSAARRALHLAEQGRGRGNTSLAYYRDRAEKFAREEREGPFPR